MHLQPQEGQLYIVGSPIEISFLNATVQYAPFDLFIDTLTSSFFYRPYDYCHQPCGRADSRGLDGVVTVRIVGAWTKPQEDPIRLITGPFTLPRIR